MTELLENFKIEDKFNIKYDENSGESNDILFNNKCHYTNNNLVIKIESDEIKSNI